MSGTEDKGGCAVLFCYKAAASQILVVQAVNLVFDPPVEALWMGRVDV